MLSLNLHKFKFGNSKRQEKLYFLNERMLLAVSFWQLAIYFLLKRHIFSKIDFIGITILAKKKLTANG